MKLLVNVASFLFLALLTACGGGGGGGGASSDAQVNSSEGSWLSFSPDSPEVTVYGGESTPITITATASKPIVDIFNIAIIDAAGVIKPDVDIKSLSPMQYAATLHTAPSLAVGPHATRLEVRLCKDAPVVCRVPVQGSPWYIPLTVNVVSGTHLPPL